MFINEAYNILGISFGSSNDIIKKAYKDIALSCHPDKLGNIDDENEKNKRINKFKQASIAYELLTNNKNNDMTWNDTKDWKEMWYSFFKNDNETKEIIKDTLYDIANHLINNKIYPKSYYNPSSNIEQHKKHEIKLEITYNDMLINCKKKLRLILVDISDIIYIDVLCGTSYPQIIKEYIDDNDIIHDIIIKFEIKKEEKWNHIISKSGEIDIITGIEIEWIDYIIGVEKELEYIDGKNIIIKIPPFQKDLFEIPLKGIRGGSLIINIDIKPLKKENWLNLQEKNKDDMIRILKTI